VFPEYNDFLEPESPVYEKKKFQWEIYSTLLENELGELPLGARVLEKHFTHDKTLPGNDHYHAMDKEDLKLLRKNLDRVSGLFGSSKKEALPDEAPARENARRSLVAKRGIPAGKKLEFEDLTWKRPASGISPRYIDEVIGREAVGPIEEDAVLVWRMLSGEEAK